MRRFGVALLAAVMAVSALAITPGRSEAQALIVVTRVYSEISRNGCLTYVAQWSDGSYTIVPWVCPFPVVPLRNDAPVPVVRSYQERGREGCLWFVSLWADGVYTGVPWSCPFGVVPIKPGTVPPLFVPVPQPFFALPVQPFFWQPYWYRP
ncbi:MAG: hypothetical protein RMM58_15655 [Chloroflexota bacterium]|nr:hypothetical protein [Dehalococcoidia bacterium]MDW8255307.1 hypothetical protein [Chloroflexota bacterium]